MGEARRGRRADLGAPLWLALAALCAVLICVVGSEPALGASCTDHFTGVSGGAWESASNWSAGLPGAGSVVCWAADTTVVVGEGSQAAASIEGGGGLVVRAGAKLELAGGSEPSSLGGQVQTADTGELDVRGRLACGSVQMSGGLVRDDGEIDCPARIGAGTLMGTGSIAAAVVNEGGTVEPGDGSAQGGLTVSSYTQGAGAVLSVREDKLGPGAVSAHLLNVAGPASLAGTISLHPALPPAGFAVLESTEEPSGYFTRVVAPEVGSPWTIGYGPTGAVAVSNGALSLKVSLTGAAQAGGTLSCAPAPGWEPRGTTAYNWRRAPEVVQSIRKLGPPEPEVLAGRLHNELEGDNSPTLTVPGTAVGLRIGCEINVWTPAGGLQSSVHAGGDFASLAIGGPYRSIKPPVITGRAVPGSSVSCAPGQWEGSPSSYSYEWISEVGSTSGQTYTVGQGRSYTIGAYEEGALICIVTAHYGPIAVPSESSVRVPVSPQPTLCPRRPVALVSVRRGRGSLLLFGAAAPRHFGERVFGLRRGSHGRWRRVGSGRVNSAGYFELHVPLHRAGAGSYRVAIGRAVSNVIDAPGVLQIASARSKPAESRVTLRVTRAGVLRVWRLNECEAAGSVASATLPAGGRLHVRLTGGSEPVAYLAQEQVADRRYTVELIVPPRPSFRPVPVD